MTPRSAAMIAACLCLALTVSAGPVVAAPLVVDDNYRLSSGDVILVTVLGEKDLSGTLAVGPGGSIALPIVGSIQVVGKTLRETRDLIARTYTDVIRQPYVSVALDETASKRRVYVGGMVDKPASYMLPLGSTPTEAIVAAGITDESDLRSVTVRHPGGEAVTVDMSGLRTQAPVDTTILLGWDDRVYVPAFENRLTVLGQVTKPGTFTIPLGRVIRVVDLLTQVAGGFTETADRRTAMLIRDSGKTTETLDLRKMLERGDMSQNYELRGGDVVVIPEADRVTVAGEVVAPASFYGGAHLTLLEALVKAGGFTARAGLKQARVKRADGQVSELDLESLWRRGDTSKNLELTPGDVLIIPRADPEEVLITGAVQKAGTVDLRDEKDRSLLKILASMGLTPSSDLSRVQIYRVGEVKVANARAAMEQGDMRGNVQLEPGDVVYVPDIGKVALLGAFARPGLVDYDPKLSLMEYLATGGILSPQMAVLSNGVLIRARPDGTYETVKIDLSRLKLGVMPEPVKVKPGDILYLEPREAGKKSFWEQVREFLWTVGSLRGLGL